MKRLGRNGGRSVPTLHFILRVIERSLFGCRVQNRAQPRTNDAPEIRGALRTYLAKQHATGRTTRSSSSCLACCEPLLKCARGLRFHRFRWSCVCLRTRPNYRRRAATSTSALGSAWGSGSRSFERPQTQSSAGLSRQGFAYQSVRFFRGALLRRRRSSRPGKGETRRRHRFLPSAAVSRWRACNCAYAARSRASTRKRRGGVSAKATWNEAFAGNFPARRLRKSCGFRVGR